MQIVSTNPIDGQVDVSVDAKIIIEFDEEPDLSTLLSSMYSLTDSENNSIELSVSKDADNPMKLYFEPQERLKTNTQYSFLLSNMDILSGTYFSSVEGNQLINGTMIKFTTVAAAPDSDIGIELDEYYDFDIEVKKQPLITSIEPSTGILTSNQIIFTFNYNITNVNGDIVSTLSKIDGTELYEVLTPQITDNSIALTLSNFESNSIIIISMPEIETEGGKFEPRLFTFVTLIEPSFVNVALIKYRLGELLKEITDYDIYMSVLDAYIELEQILRQPLVGQPSLDFGVYNSAVRKFLQAAALTNLFKMIIAKKAAYGGDSFSSQSTQWRVGQIRPETIKFYEDEKKQALELLQPLIDKKRATIEGVERGAALLKQKLYSTFEKFRWDEGKFGFSNQQMNT